MSEIRIFTLEEAEKTLPLLNRILADLKAGYQRWQAAVAHYEVLAAASRADTGETDDLVASRTAVSEAANQISGYLLEIESIGCLFKGFEEGLVDFYALRDDRLVFLCWKYGEPKITHWHEVDAGFPGRQPIDANAFSPILP